MGCCCDFSVDETIRSVSQLDEILCEVEWVKQGKKKNYANVPAVVDIESSSFIDSNGNKTALMYAFVFGINGKCVIGRSMDELKEVFKRIQQRYETNGKNRFIIYVHNLSYEFQFFRKEFEWTSVFAIEERKPIYAVMKGGIELRCSYRLSGYALANVGKNLNKYKVSKMVGDLDYKKIRSEKTPLTAKELGYINHDGLVVMSYIQELMEEYGNIAKLPYTNTGFVRNYCRNYCLYSNSKNHHDTNHQFGRYRELMKELTLEPSEYLELREAFQGGFTHANPLASGMTCNDVTSFDFTSSYPSVLLNEKFPMTKGEKYQPKDKKDFEDSLKYYCCLFRCEFESIESRIDFEHYISVSKCRKLKDFVSDNGRLVSAQSMEITLTEQDYKLITKVYRWKHVRIFDMIRYSKSYLPKPFIQSILDLYQKKTTLKGVEGEEVNYMRSKGQLNACYGMTVTNICRDEIGYKDEWKTDIPDLEKTIEDYNRDIRRFLFYPWGIWVTAYARRNLWSGILECRNDYLYSDTDSIKIINAEKHLNFIHWYNGLVSAKLHDSMNTLGLDFNLTKPKTKDGVEKPIGVWDFDGHYQRFKTEGAKRYLTEDDKGKLHLTISGVNKKFAEPYLEWKYKNHDTIFQEFRDGLMFPCEYDNGKSATGKNLLTYIDDERKGTAVDYLGQPFDYDVKSGIHMEENSYNMTLSEDYMNYLIGMRKDYQL